MVPIKTTGGGGKRKRVRKRKRERERETDKNGGRTNTVYTPYWRQEKRCSG
jgi:hypothetical protein